MATTYALGNISFVSSEIRRGECSHNMFSQQAERRRSIGHCEVTAFVIMDVYGHNDMTI